MSDSLSFPPCTVDPYEWPLETVLPTHAGEVACVSEKAMVVLWNLESAGYRVLSVKETLSHDRYDRYGPKSDIWSLHISTYARNPTLSPIVLVFGWENWFIAGDREKGYEFYEVE